MLRILAPLFLLISGVSFASTSIPFRNLSDSELHELVALVVQDVQLTQEEKLITETDQVVGLEEQCEEDAVVSGLVVTSFSGKTYYEAGKGNLHWASMQEDFYGTVNLVDYFEVGSNGDAVIQPWPILVRWGIRILLGAAGATGSCSIMQSQCYSGCASTCPCGASPEFSCVQTSGFVDCNCNCVDCDQFDHYDFQWPYPSPIFSGGSSFPYLYWDYDLGGMLQVPGLGGVDFISP